MKISSKTQFVGMNFITLSLRNLRLFSFILLSGVFVNAQAAESAVTKAEIAYLFKTLETSNCQFNRNGSWYGAQEASDHLNTKYKYLQGKDWVPSAENFIERAATQSSFSGKAYLIKCADGVAQPSAPWFTAVLMRYRMIDKVK